MIPNPQMSMTAQVNPLCRSEGVALSLIYLSALEASTQHRTVFPVVQVQTLFCKRLIFLPTKYTKTAKQTIIRTHTVSKSINNLTL